MLQKSRGMKKTNTQMATENTPVQSVGKGKTFTKKHFIIIAILLIALFVWKYKGFLIAATVNGQPISRWQLNDQLSKKFGDQVLDNIINERLILAAAREKGIFITKKEIDDRVNEVKTKLSASMDFNQALKAQGLTESDFHRQVEIQLSIDKMFDKEASISSVEIEDYIVKNNTLLKSATNPAALREDVRLMLKQQKVGDLFDKWFTEVRQKASINKFL